MRTRLPHRQAPTERACAASGVARNRPAPSSAASVWTDAIRSRPRLSATLTRKGPAHGQPFRVPHARRLQQVGDAGSLLFHLGQGLVHRRAAEVLALPAFDAGVLAFLPVHLPPVPPALRHSVPPPR